MENAKKLFMLCCEEESLSSVKTLLNKYPEFVNEPDQYGITPFFCAVKRNHLDIASYLYSKGADIEAKNRAGQSALFWTAANNDLQGTKYLLELGANINSVDKVKHSNIIEQLDSYYHRSY
jgi:ankyrin repeat protein